MFCNAAFLAFDSVGAGYLSVHVTAAGACVTQAASESSLDTGMG